MSSNLKLIKFLIEEDYYKGLHKVLSVMNFKKNEVFTESIRPRKETQDIEIEVWSYEKNKFTQHYSNK